MDSQAKPTRKRTRTRKVEQPPTEKVELTVEEPLDIPENRYQRKQKVGANPVSYTHLTLPTTPYV